MRVAEKKNHYVDNGWPKDEEGGSAHAVSEFAATISGALSPFGDVEFPLPTDTLPYIVPKTQINS